MSFPFSFHANPGSVHRRSAVFWPWLLLGVAASVVPLSMLRADRYFSALVTGSRLETRDFDSSHHERLINGMPLVLLMAGYAVWAWRLLRAGRSSDSAGDESLPLPSLIDERRPMWRLLKFAWPFLLIAWLVYPYSGDIRVYMHYGQMANANVNPLTHRADSFFSPWLDTLAWGQTSTYGPVGLFLFSIAARFHVAGLAITSWHQTVLPIYAFKLICLALHVITAWLIAQLLSPRADRWTWALLYAVNPIVLFEQVSNAHVDVAVVALLAASLLAVRRDQWVLAGAAMLAATLTKTIAIIWLPLLGIAMLRARRYSAAAICLALAAGVAVLLACTVVPNTTAWMSLGNAGIGSQMGESFHSSVLRLLAHPLHVPYSVRHAFLGNFTLAAKVSFVVLSGMIAVQLWTRRDASLAGGIALATLLLFVLASPWYRAWYATVLLFPPLFLAVGFWVRAAILALVIGGSVGTAVFGPSLAHDVIASWPAAICLMVGAVQRLRLQATASSEQPLVWDEEQLETEFNPG